MNMIETKILEIRDRGTCMPVMAVNCNTLHFENGQERWLMARAGFGPANNIYVIHLEGKRATYNAYDWEGSRTMREAHIYIEENWGSLQPGEVIDIEFLNGETSEKKKSDRLWVPPKTA